MTPVVVEVGPETVHGPRRVPRPWMSAALDCIDDPIALLDDHPVEVTRLWRDVLTTAGERAGSLVLVIPTWWSAGRIGVLEEVCLSMCSDSVVLQRTSLLRQGGETVVELSVEYAVVAHPGAAPQVFDRADPAVSAELDRASSVLLDVPDGVVSLPATTTADLRCRGIPLSYSTHHRIRRLAVAAVPPSVPRGHRVERVRLGRRTCAVLAGTVVAGAAAGGGWAAQAFTMPAVQEDSTRVLVEGGVAVRVPADWTVERITAGAGSARVRIAAPGGSPALHLTQSESPATGTLAAVAESLRQAIDAEPEHGVFVDLDPSARPAGRPAVSYLERRSGSDTRWAVLVDGTTRIAIGCQSTPDTAATIDGPCADAVGSAHVVR